MTHAIPAVRNPRTHLERSNQDVFSQNQEEEHQDLTQGGGGNMDLQTPPQSSRNQRPPAPVPLDLATNADAIALRSAMSILQLQKRQALADIQTLEAQKQMALDDVRGFAQATAAGKVTSRDVKGVWAAGRNDDDDKANGDNGDSHEQAFIVSC